MPKKSELREMIYKDQAYVTVRETLYKSFNENWCIDYVTTLCTEIEKLVKDHKKNELRKIKDSQPF